MKTPSAKGLIKLSGAIILLLSLAISTGFTNKPANDTLSVGDYLNLSREYFSDDYNKAYEYALEGLARADRARYPLERIRLLQAAAEIEYFYLNKHLRSINHLNEMRALSDSIGYKRGVPWYNLNLGNVFYYQNYFNRALELFEEAMSGAAELNDTIIYVNALTAKADILRQRNEFDSATALISVGLDYARRAKNMEMQLFLLDDLGDISKRKGLIDSSFYYYRQTCDIARELKSDYWIIVSSINLEYLRFLSDRTYDPVPKLEALQEEALELRFIRQYIDIGNTLAEVFSSRNQYREALQRITRVTAVKDSLYNSEEIGKILEMEAHYDLHKAQVENLELSRSNEMALVKLSNRKKVTLIILAALSLALILLWQLRKKYLTVKKNLVTIKNQEQKISEQKQRIIRQEKDAIEHKMMIRERKLTEKFLQVYHNDQLFRKLMTELTSIQDHLNSTEQSVLEESRAGIQALINQVSLSSGEQLWNEFEKQFIEISPDFIDKLHSRHPALTVNETRLSIFLFLNLRTKEISSITGQSVKSINVARARLRKKLRIDNSSVSLHSYLREL